MSPPRSWSRESALPASPVTPRLRRRHSFSRSAGTSRYFRLYRSRNHLSHHEISSRWLHLKVPKPRAHPAAPRFLRHPFSSRLRRDAAGSRQTNVVASFPGGNFCQKSQHPIGNEANLQTTTTERSGLTPEWTFLDRRAGPDCPALGPSVQRLRRMLLGDYPFGLD